jgi:hypothetical protein
LKRVPIAQMEQLMLKSPVVAPARETREEPVRAPRYPPSVAMRRRNPNTRV